MLMVPPLFTKGGSMEDRLLTLITPLLLRPANAWSTSPGPFRLICPVASLVSRPLTVMVFPPPAEGRRPVPELSTAPLTVSVLPFSTATSTNTRIGQAAEVRHIAGSHRCEGPAVGQGAGDVHRVPAAAEKDSGQISELLASPLIFSVLPLAANYNPELSGRRWSPDRRGH